MQTTLDLVTRAMERTQTPSRRELARRLGMSPTALNNAVLRGTISPIAAGQLAELAGEDIAAWMAKAALESAPKTAATQRLKRALEAVAKF